MLWLITSSPCVCCTHPYCVVIIDSVQNRMTSQLWGIVWNWLERSIECNTLPFVLKRRYNNDYVGNVELCQESQTTRLAVKGKECIASHNACTKQEDCWKRGCVIVGFLPVMPLPFLVPRSTTIVRFNSLRFVPDLEIRFIPQFVYP